MDDLIGSGTYKTKTSQIKSRSDDVDDRELRTVLRVPSYYPWVLESNPKRPTRAGRYFSTVILDLNFFSPLDTTFKRTKSNNLEL